MSIQTLTLADLKPGDNAKIKKINIKGMLGQRLIDLGLYPGLTINVVRRAPLGDPLEITAEGTPISLRKDEARYIAVERVL
jgi:ferrous iron transport protein A